VQLDIRQIRLAGLIAGRQLFLDVSVADSAEGDSTQVMLWFFFIEFEEKGFDRNPRLGFVLVLIRGSDEGCLSLSLSIGLRLVIPELPDVGSLRPLLER
jgi:hypothetical protein